MRTVNLEDSKKNPWISATLIGPTRGGKTTFLATFPRPLILAEASERGWTTIGNMPSNLFFEPDRRPEVWAIEDDADMLKALTEVKSVLIKDPQRFLTIGIDSLTFFADAKLSRLKTILGGDAKGFALYGSLAEQLRWLTTETQRLPRNVVWTMLPRFDENGALTGVSVPGQEAMKTLAKVDYQFYCRSTRDDPKEPLRHEVRTRPFEAMPRFNFGGRDFGKLPDVLPEASYRCLAKLLGLPDPLKL